MRYLTKTEIIRINHTQVERYGGHFVPPHNFLHEASLDYLIEAVQMEMFGEPLYPAIHQKAGLYMFNIVCNHVFHDGNKRTGLQAAIIFLLLNGHHLRSDEDEILINFTLSVAAGEQTLEQVQAWFERHIEVK